jgi:hypothetical protein
MIENDENNKFFSIVTTCLKENGIKIKDSDRLLGKIQKSDEFFVMRYFDVDPLLKKRSYFFKRQSYF